MREAEHATQTRPIDIKVFFLLPAAARLLLQFSIACTEAPQQLLGWKHTAEQKKRRRAWVSTEWSLGTFKSTQTKLLYVP